MQSEKQNKTCHKTNGKPATIAPAPKPFELDSSERENFTNAENVQTVEEQQDTEDQRPCAEITHAMLIILGKIAAYTRESTYLEKLKPRKDIEKDYDALVDNVKLALGEDFLTALRSKYNALLDEGKLVRALPMAALSGNNFSDGVKALCISVSRAVSDLAANEYKNSELKITELLHKANNETFIATLIGKAALHIGENLQKYSKDVEIRSLERLME